MLQPLPRVVNFEDRLFLIDLHRKMGGDGIGEARRVLDARQRGENFRWCFLVEFDVLLEVSKQRTGQRLDFTPLFGPRFECGNARAEERFSILEPFDSRPLPSFHQHLHSAVGKLEELQNCGDRPDPVNLLNRRIVLAGVHLRDEQDPLVTLHRLLERLNRPIPADKERDHHVRIDNDIP